jgi:Pentapeptide repeats (9 copies)
MNDSEKPDCKAGEAKLPKMNAEDNLWYLLATLYGVPGMGDDELRKKNRIAWNRYYSANLDEETRTKLIEAKRRPAEELAPYSPDELQEVRRAFTERWNPSAKKLTLMGFPGSNALIDFSDVGCEQNALFEGYLFGGCSSFRGATFSGAAIFSSATFSGAANFDGSAFSGGAIFYGATFSGGASFRGATFSGEAFFGSATFSLVAIFERATFCCSAIFDGAAFPGVAFFGRTTISGGASFGGATFSALADFNGAAFSGRADFANATFGGDCNFVNAEMKGSPSFSMLCLKRSLLDSSPPSFTKERCGAASYGRRSRKIRTKPGTSSMLMLASSSKWTG